MARVAHGLVVGQAVFAVAILAFIHSASGLVCVPVLPLVCDFTTAFSEFSMLCKAA